MKRALLAITMAAAALGTGIAYAMQEPEVPYDAGDVLRTLAIMDEFVTMDDSYHMVVDRTAAAANPAVTELDVEIALDYAAHSDAVVDAAAEMHIPESYVTYKDPGLWSAIGDLEEGKFRNVFGQGDSPVDVMTELGDAPGLLIFLYHLAYMS